MKTSIIICTRNRADALHQMKTSIIICTRNRADALHQTLLSLSQVKVPPSISSELIVVDNGSTDHTRQVVQSCSLTNMAVQYLHEPRKGQCYARNAGIAASQGDIIQFTDDDVKFPANWIEEMCEPIVSGRADAVAGGFTTAPHLLRSWMDSTSTGDALTPDSPEEAQESQPMVGLNMAFSRKVLEKVPAFDTELGPGALGFNDDFFFSWQVENAGYRIARRFEVSVEHHYDASRLHRVYALQRAVACGRSDAYLEHHWHHRRIWFARWHLRRSTLRLALFRWLRKNEMRDQERIPSWEFDLVKQVNFYKQYMVERWRPRNYQKNGLVKRTPTSRPHSTA